jgi:actin-related protein
MDIRKEMSQNIFVTGGCTMLPGFVERLEVEVTKLCPPHLKPKVSSQHFTFMSSI